MRHEIDKKTRPSKSLKRHCAGERVNRLIVIGLWMFPLFVGLLASCGQKPKPTTAYYTDGQRLQLDTTGNHTKNIDSLMQLVARYQQTGERAREMGAQAELGHAFQTSSRYSEAIRTHQAQLDIAEELQDTLMIVSALNDLGVNYRRMGLYYDGLDYHLRAVEASLLNGEDADEKMLKCRAIGYNGAGNAYLTAGHYQKADEMLRKALAVETRLGSHLGMNVDCSNIGIVFERRGMIDSARVYFARSMWHSRKAGSTTGLAYSHMNFGRLYQMEGKHQQATEEFRTSMNIIDKNRDQWLWLQPCIALAGAYLEAHTPDSAYLYLDMALKTAQRIGTKEYNPKIYRLYSAYYKNQGDYEEALNYYIRANEEEDSLLNARNLFEIEMLQNEILRRQQERNALIVEKRIQGERLMKWMFATGFALFLSLSAMLWYVAHTRKKAYRVQKAFIKVREAFFTNITHEFRTPLTVILGMSEEVKEDKDCPISTRERGRIIEQQSHNLLMLVNQLLDISKVKSAIGNGESVYGNITTHLSMIVESYRDYAKGKNILLQFFAKEEVMMDFMPDYINKMMNNLLSNAFKFTSDYGKIDVLTWREEERLLIDVTDTGKGISHEQIPHVFEPFYQAGSETKTPGTGIGLALVKQIIDTIGGKISVESRVGEGTKFHVDLPIRHHNRIRPADGRQEENIPLLPAEEVALIDDDDRGECRILVIEDNKDIATYIGSILSEHYAVSYAVNGKQGLEKALDLVPDLMITDLMMPELDGLEVCRRVRNNEVINHIPIIVVTAKITEQDRVKGLEAGADAYLAKPFSRDELRIRVEKLLEQRRLLREKYMPAENGQTEEAEEIEKTEETEETENLSSQNCANRRFLHKLTHHLYLMIANNEVLEIETIASNMCMSYSQLRRKLYALTGYTPQAYIRHVKIKRAQQLLTEDPNLSFIEVALQSGFSDYSNFVRSFKNVVGITPTQYVKGE